MIGVGISAGLSGAKRTRSIQDPLPALDLDWATDRSLPAAYGPTPSFSRASTGTVTNSSGVLTTAAVNAPRFDHTYNGTSWVSKGLLVEEQRTNLHLYSQQFDNAAWIKFDSTISADFAAAPDGTTTADKNIPNTSNAAHGVYNNAAASISSGVKYTASVYAKASGYNFIFVVGNVNGSSTLGGVCVNLTNGSQSNGGASGTYSVTNVGNGWWRISCSVTSVGTNGYIEIFPRSTAGNNASFAGNGTDGVLIWGTQLELGAFPTSYIPTTTAAVTRSADVCQITGGDFSGFWNASEGSFAVEFDFLNPIAASYETPVIFRNSAFTERAWLRKTNASPQGIHFLGTNGNVNQVSFDLTGSLPSANTTNKASVGLRLNDFAGTANGNAVSTDTSANMPVCTTMEIGSYGDGSAAGFLNGHIARLRYYPTRLTNAKLEELST
jgi:hypothetical protein